MSWSRSYSGTAKEVIQSARAELEQIKSGLPEFEKGDVQYAIDAADLAVDAVPEGAKISLSLAGHGYRDPTDSGGGALSISVNYSLTAKP